MRTLWLLISVTVFSSVNVTAGHCAALIQIDGVSHCSDTSGQISWTTLRGIFTMSLTPDPPAGIIEELLNRAEIKVSNLLPPGRFEWSWTGFDQPREMVEHAEELLNTFSSGKDPFEGKYAEPGGYVVDHTLINKDGSISINK